MERNVDDLMKDCQTLLSSNPTCNGWLRMPSKSHNIGNIIGNKFNALTSYTKNFTNKYCWNHKFVILYDKYLFVFKEATSKITEKIIRLAEYKKVKECHVESASVPWPFKLWKRSGGGFQMFSAASQDERTKWIEAIDTFLDGVEDTVAAEESGDEELYNIIKAESENDDDSEASGSSNYEEPACDGTTERKKIPLPPLPQPLFIKPSTKSHGKALYLPLTPLIEPSPSSIRSPSIQPRTPVPNIPAPKLSKQTFSIKKNMSKKAPPNKPLPKTPKKPIPEVVRRASDSRTRTPTREVYEGDLVYEDTSRTSQTLSEMCMWSGSADGAYEVMTKHLNKTGVYLIRKATTGNGYTLAVIDGDIIRKFSILKQNNMYSLLKSEFDDLEGLLQHFSNNNIPNRTLKLNTPYSNS